MRLGEERNSVRNRSPIREKLRRWQIKYQFAATSRCPNGENLWSNCLSASVVFSLAAGRGSGNKESACGWTSEDTVHPLVSIAIYHRHPITITGHLNATGPHHMCREGRSTMSLVLIDGSAISKSAIGVLLFGIYQCGFPEAVSAHISTSFTAGLVLCAPCAAHEFADTRIALRPNTISERFYGPVNATTHSRPKPS